MNCYIIIQILYISLTPVDPFSYSDQRLNTIVSQNHDPQNRTDYPSQTVRSRGVQGLPRQCLARGLTTDS